MANAWDALYGSLPNVMSYGATGNGVTDDQTAIQAALTANANGSLFFPPGNYLHSSSLSANGVKIYGWLKQSQLTATTDVAALTFSGSNIKLIGMNINGNNTRRLQTDNSCCVLVNSVTGFEISYNLIQKCAGAGIKMNTSTSGWVHHNAVQNTFADGIHHVKGTNNVLTEENDVYGTGDDCISVVSYRADTICSNITVQNNRVGYNIGARGITCIGGNNVVIRGNNINTPLESGIQIACEESYDTWGCDTISVLNNYLYYSGISSKGLGAIHMYNGGGVPGTLTLNNLLLDKNHIELPRGAYTGIFSTGTFTIIGTVSNNTGRTSGTFYAKANTGVSTAITTSNNSSWSV